MFSFFRRELKHEVAGESLDVSLDRPLECLGCDGDALCDISIQHYLLAANQQDSLCDPLDRDRCALRSLLPLNHEQPSRFIFQASTHMSTGWFTGAFSGVASVGLESAYRPCR